jgi:hypothetical protein
VLNGSIAHVPALSFAVADGAVAYQGFAIVTKWLMVRCGLVVEEEIGGS